MRSILFFMFVCFISGVTQAGDTLRSEPHRLRLPLPPGRNDTAVLKRLLREIVARYEEGGYLDAAASIVGGDTDAMTLLAEIIPGRQFHLANVQTQPELIQLAPLLQRLISVDTGAPLNTALRSSLGRSAARPVTWERVGSIQYLTEPGDARAQARVRYRPLPPIGLRGSGGAGFGAGNSAVGAISILARRPLAADDQAAVTLQRTAAERLLHVDYENWFVPVGPLRYRLWLDNHDRTGRFTENVLGASVSGLLNNGVTLGSELSVSQITGALASDHATIISSGFFGRISGGRERIPPSREISWRVLYRQTSGTGEGNIDMTARSQTVRGELTVREHVPISSVLGLSLHAATTLNSSAVSLPESELIPVGGYSSLRGYAERQFLTPNVAVLQFQPSIRLGSSWLYSFLDVAMLERPTGAGSFAVKGTGVWSSFSATGFGLTLTAARRRLDIGMGFPMPRAGGEARLFAELAESL